MAERRSTRTQFRVVSKRAGIRAKAKTYGSMAAVQRRLTLLGPAPWEAFGLGPDDFFCCAGHECSCGGETQREATLRMRAQMPELDSVRVETREVTPWVPLVMTAGGLRAADREREKDAALRGEVPGE